MLKETRFEQVYLVCGYTDMRRSIDGLAAIIQQNFDLEPCSGSLFLFCGKRRDRLKALLWEGDGFLLMYKRLDNGCFQWPRNGAEAKLLTHEQYIRLLQGLSVEQPKAIKQAPKKVSAKPPRGLNKRSKSDKLNPKGSEEVLRPDWSWLEWIR